MLKHLTILVAFGFLTISARATTYYVAANGLDTNNGTSTSTPWLHAPGMSTCTGICASTTINAGDLIIFRGGDTWHFGNSALSPFAGFTSRAWTLPSSGTSTNCQLNPSLTVVKTSCIYVGVDETWFTGAAWTRPALNGDNPISNTPPAGGCTYQNGVSSPGDSQIWVTLANYTIFDNFEILGYCWDLNTLPPGTTSPVSVSSEPVIKMQTMNEISNCYFHGWSEGPNATSTNCNTNLQCDADAYPSIGSAYTQSATTPYTRIDHNVFDGSDSTFGNQFGAYGDASGEATKTGGEIDDNVFWHVSNIVKDTPVFSFHDNLINYAYEPWPSGTHGNIWEMGPYGWTISTYSYNNLVLNAVIGETFDLYPGGSTNSKTGYVFNNVMANPDGHAGVNCYLLESGDAQGTGPFQFFNNTSVSACVMREAGGKSNTVVFQNNHFINYSPATLGQFSTATTNTDNGNEAFATTMVANSQGYMVGNNWAPTSANCNGITSNCTVRTGANLSSICNSMDNALAASECLLGVPTFTYNTTNHIVTVTPGNPRPSIGAWDEGAYQFQAPGGSVVAPNSIIRTGAAVR